MFKKLKYIPFTFNAMTLVFVVVMAGVFVSCEKDEEIAAPVKPSIAEELCTPIPAWSGIGMRPSIIDSAYFTNPIVNPSNPDEIVFLSRIDNSVYKINYVSGEKNVVLEDGISFSWADWGVNDWILFTRSQNLYKVKSNGDSLIQITFNGVGWYANWNPTGNKYTYVTSSPGSGLMSVVANKDDLIIDTLPVVINALIDWASDSIIYWSLGSYKLGTDILGYNLPLGSSGDVAGLDSSVSFHGVDGLVRVNRENGMVTQIHPPYSNCERYLWLDYSRQKQKLLTQRIYRELMSDGIHQYIRHDIVWLNLDGTVHEVIDIAQFMDE